MTTGATPFDAREPFKQITCTMELHNLEVQATALSCLNLSFLPVVVLVELHLTGPFREQQQSILIVLASYVLFKHCPWVCAGHRRQL
jgi:hypothetical protein